jgi:5-methyltetrahydrofolate--homocysteine methyltransferase
MLIVGERINTSRKRIYDAVEKRDREFIQNEAMAQIKMGADVIDVNAGSRLGTEIKDLMWIIDVIQETIPVRISIDSTDPECMLEGVRKVRDMPMVNSLTAEKVRFERMKPAIQERECEIIALCMDDRGIPRDVDQILENAEKLIGWLEDIGIKRNRIYLDPLIQSMSTNTRAGVLAIEAIERINRDLKGVRTICGLSNISFGLPNRHLINRTFLPIMIKAGLSAAIIDPLDKRLMATMITTRLLLGMDDFCMEYISAYREGKLTD